MSIALLIAALLPAAVLMVYVYRKDSVEKEPIGLVVRVFLLGVIAGPCAAIVENILFNVFESALPAGALLLILEYFIGVAAVEEAFKYLALSTVRKNREFNYVFDGIVYAVAAALGFAALENVLYVFDGGFEVAMSRAIFAVPGHCADGVVMGCFFGLARHRELSGDKATARTYYFMAFLLPMLEHGFYDCALSTESDLMVLLALAVEIAFIAFAMVLVSRISKQDKPFYGTAQGAAPTGQAPASYKPSVQPSYVAPASPVAPTTSTSAASGVWTCPRCGHANASKFCGECGLKRP